MLAHYRSNNRRPQSRAALEIEGPSLRQNTPVVLSMSTLRPGALFLAATAVCEDPRKVMEAISAVVSVHEAPPDQLAERRVRRLRLQLPDRGCRGSVEARGKDG